jgi:serine/threonine protein kinase
MRHEIEVQTDINHANIMPVYDFSTSYRWYTMPIAHTNLYKMTTPVDEFVLFEIIQQCAYGLAAAHAKGYIHRDLTPSNIMQLQDNDGVRWVISDWGLVRRHGMTTISRTLSGQPFGTVGFAAPEMWEDAHAVDSRADIYSLGRVVGWCLSGQWPRHNVQFIPSGIWGRFVDLTTQIDVNRRVNDINEVFGLLEEISSKIYMPFYHPTASDNHSPQIITEQEIDIDIDNDLLPLIAIDKNSDERLNGLEAKHIIAQRSREVLYALRDANFGILSDFVHPKKGVRFSPYSFVELQDVVLFADNIKQVPFDNRSFLWGSYDGTGYPIQLRFSEYYKRFIYSNDFVHADRVGYNESIGEGATINNAFDFYPNSIIVEYYFMGFDPQYGGMDWESLRLVFEKEDDTWYIIGIIHDCWTI